VISANEPVAARIADMEQVALAPFRDQVVVAETLAAIALEVLARDFEVVDRCGSSRADLLASLDDASALIVRSATKVDAELIAAAPRLRVIARAGIGVDNIDVDTATARGILVVNAPQANSISAAEHTMALLLSQARHIPRADARTRAGVWDRASFQGVELHGKVLGIVGLGRIGSLVADRAHAFGMKVLAYDPFIGIDRARRQSVELVGLEVLLAEADFITIHLPLTSETEGLLGKDNLARCKPGVRIVNTSRGGIVDEGALAEAVRSGLVAGAALDVFAQEPLGESPLCELEQVVLTPHLGASTVEAQDKAGVQVAEAVVAALRGELVLTAVNVDLGREVSEEVRGYLGVAEQMGAVFIGLAGAVPEQLKVTVRGHLASADVRPLGLAVLKGVLQAVSTGPVSYVNVNAIAHERGIALVLEADERSPEYVSTMTCAGQVNQEDVVVSATSSRKGPMLVEILGHDVELPISRHLLIVRNADVPGMIGKVGTFLGDAGVNIANMVVGRSRMSNEAAMMGMNLDSPLGDDDIARLRLIPGVEQARYIEVR